MKVLLKLLGCFLVAILSLVLSGFVSQLLKLPSAAVADQTLQMLMAALACCILTAGLIPLARGLGGPGAVRACAMTAFMLLAFAVNTLIEAFFFITTFRSSAAAAAAMYLVSAVLIGWATGLMFGSSDTPSALPTLRFTGDLGRTALAWIGWPFIYLLFGSCIAPIVLPYYRSIPSLHIPPLGTIVAVQLVRSVFFLASSLPLIALWRGSRRDLWFSLGLAHFVTVGGFGVVAGTFLNAVLRITHGIEIACDSFAYAGLLVLLFGGEKLALSHSSHPSEQPPALAL